MRIDWIEATNFGSFYGTHRLELSDLGLVLVVGQNNDNHGRMASNGAGKSTLCADAIDWGLYGSIPKGDHVDSVVNDIHGKDCRVRLQVTDDQDQTILIERWRGRQDGRKKNGTALWVDGQDQSALDDNETQRKITKLLGMDRTVFHAAVLYGQNDLLRFCESSNKDRLAVVTQILDLESIDGWADRTKLLIKDCEARVAAARRTEYGTEQRLATLEETSIVALAEQWEQEKAKWLTQAANQIEHLREQVAALGAGVTDTAPLEVELQTLMGSSPSQERLGALHTELNGVTTAMERLRLRHEHLANEFKRTQSGIQKLHQTGQGTCSACGQEITEQHIAGEELRMNEQLQKTHDEMGGIGAEFEAGQQSWHRIKEELDYAQVELEGKQQKHNMQIHHVTAQLEAARGSKRTLSEKTNELIQLEADHRANQSAPNPYSAQVALHEDKKKQASIELGKSKKTREELEGRLRHLVFWSEGLKDKGLKNLVLDYRLGEMTDAANKWVGLLTDDTMWIQFEAQKQTRTGKISNTLNLKVFLRRPDGSVVERGFKSFSGGERQRIALGVDFGLSGLLARRSKRRWDILILDELFRHLDSTGRQACVRMLHQLAKEKSTILVIDHDQETQHAFDQTITIEKSQGRSRVMEETDG
jgi:DNA repair exonuclease SbcCD ATPase subunit